MNPQMMEAFVACRIRDIQQQAVRPIAHRTSVFPPPGEQARIVRGRWSQARTRLGFSLIAAGLRLVADATAPQA